MSSRPHRRLLAAFVTVITCLPFGSIRSAAAGDDALDAALRAMPAGAVDALFVIPDMRRASDEMANFLDGMNRSDLLLGARPIDHFKSMFGASSAVDDLGTLLIALVAPPAGAASEVSPGTVVVVPVTDAVAFLNNFKPTAEAGHYDVLEGGSIRARAVGNHVLLTPDLPLAALQPRGADGPGWLETNLGPGAKARLGEGEAAFIVARRRIESDQARLPVWVRDRLPPPSPLTDSLFESARAAVRSAGATGGMTVFDLDPLALIARTHVRLPPVDESTPPPSRPPLGRLPARPYHMAATFDVRGDLLEPVGVFLEELVGTGGGSLLETWRAIGDRLQIAIYAPPAGPEGGLVSEAVMIFETPDPEAAREAFRRAVVSAGEQGGGIVYAGDWREDHVINGVGTMTAWSVDVREWPAETPPIEPALFSMLFGRSGASGAVTTVPGALVVTFGRRTAHVQSVLDAADRRAKTLETDPVITVMRQWLPAAPVAEAYVASGDLAALLRETLPLLPGSADWIVPPIDRGQPPIGFALRREPDGFHAVTIVPAGVRAGAIDHMKKRIIGGAGEAAR